MDVHPYDPKLWLLCVLFFSACTRTEGALGPRKRPSENLYASAYGTSFSTVRQETDNVLEDVSEILGDNPAAASGGLSDVIEGILANPSGSPGLNGDDIGNVPMESSSAMEMPVPSPTSFTETAGTMVDGPLVSPSAMMFMDASITVVASPSPEVSLLPVSPMISELASSTVAFPNGSIEPESSSQSPSLFPSDEFALSPDASSTPAMQQTFAPMTSPQPVEFPAAPSEDGTIDLPPMSVSPMFAEASVIPGGNMGETIVPSLSEPSPASTTEILSSATASSEEPLADPLTLLSPQPSAIMGTPFPSGIIGTHGYSSGKLKALCFHGHYVFFPSTDGM
ncbi:unnamed protein product [Agarophyton chilense]